MVKVKEKGFMHEKFDWECYPEAEKLLQKQLGIFVKNSPVAKAISRRMTTQTSTLLFDWVDHIVLPEDKIKSDGLKKLGFSEFCAEVPNGCMAFRHNRSVFFPILISDSDAYELVLKPESLEDFVRVFPGRIDGEKFGHYRKAAVNRHGKFILSASERRGYGGFVAGDFDDIDDYKKALSAFSSRKRTFGDDADGMAYTKKLVRKTTKKLSTARTADAFFRNERLYWQKRNKAGQIQKKRQDALGLGWGNHDHHTYRSSRENFAKLIGIFEALGYVCRERFYAGEAAGWGAQILEHPECEIVIFADVDITSEERHDDFAHHGLEHEKKLGTVGLWIGLHGESILQAGMHHLEARFEFDKLCKDLPKHGVNVMKPFSYFPFLKQAFTEGDRWQVSGARLNALLKKGSISNFNHQKFLKEGAIGSHMENLQRLQGFKGFNQDSVSAIIKATDPRKQIKHRGA